MSYVNLVFSPQNLPFNYAFCSGLIRWSDTDWSLLAMAADHILKSTFSRVIGLHPFGSVNPISPIGIKITIPSFWTIDISFCSILLRIARCRKYLISAQKNLKNSTLNPLDPGVLPPFIFFSASVSSLMEMGCSRSPFVTSSNVFFIAFRIWVLTSASISFASASFSAYFDGKCDVNAFSMLPVPEIVSFPCWIKEIHFLLKLCLSVERNNRDACSPSSCQAVLERRIIPLIAGFLMRSNSSFSASHWNWWFALFLSPCSFNPRPAGPLDFPPPAGGGGGVWTPPHDLGSWSP